ncbi:hypothetical protein AAY473_035439 [Plecturocebus cupreus]
MSHHSWPTLLFVNTIVTHQHISEQALAAFLLQQELRGNAIAMTSMDCFLSQPCLQECGNWKAMSLGRQSKTLPHTRTHARTREQARWVRTTQTELEGGVCVKHLEDDEEANWQELKMVWVSNKAGQGKKQMNDNRGL